MTTLPFAEPAPAVTRAPHSRRIPAAILDGVFGAIAVGICGTVGFLIGLGIGGANGTSDDGWEELGWILLGSLVGLAIGMVVWLVLVVGLMRRPGVHNGQTIGKQMLGIRVMRAGGGDIGAGWAFMREILVKGLLVAITSSAISALLGFADGGAIGALGAIALWYGPAFFDDERRGLHDRLCDTRVVLAARQPAAPAAPAAPATPAAADEDLWPATT
jgi:uncharacterized RDD family membrane protein YckC